MNNLAEKFVNMTNLELRNYLNELNFMERFTGAQLVTECLKRLMDNYIKQSEKSDESSV